MALVNGYATVQELKIEIGKSSETEDTRLEDIITGVSRAIDSICGRQFFATDEARLFTAEYEDELHIDECHAISLVEVDSDLDRTYSEVWQSSDWEVTGFPSHRIYASPAGDYLFPTETSWGGSRVNRNTVRVTASWGFCPTGQHPEAIKRALLLFSQRVWKRNKAVFGAQVASANGIVTLQKSIAQDPEIMALLGPYIRRVLVL